MRFLTFNLWHGLSPSSPVSMEALEPTGRRSLREQLQLEVAASVQADVHFFQEANPVRTRCALLSEAVGSEGVFQRDLTGMKLFGVGVPYNLNSGLITAVRRKWAMKPLQAVSLSRPGTNFVRNWGSWQLREERFALMCETILPGWGKVLLVNAHIHHGLEATDTIGEELIFLADELELPASAVSELKERLAKGNAKRALELEVLFRTIESLEDRYEAIVVGGDFNSRPSSKAYAKFTEHGFRDAWAEANPQDPGLTFDSETNLANHLLQKKFPLTLVVEDLSFSTKVKERLMTLARKHERSPRRIDYLFFRSKSVKLAVKSASLIGKPNAEGLAPSDHYGVCADIEAT